MKARRFTLAMLVLMSVTVALAATPEKRGTTSTRVATPSTRTPGSDVAVPEPVKPVDPDNGDAAPVSEPVETVAPITTAPEPQSTAAVPAGAAAAVNMDWYSINNGGAIEVASGNIKMGLSVGQNAVGEVSAGNIKMGLGFWYGAAGGATPGCVCDCHADPQCDGVFDIFDVTHAVNIAFRNGAAIPDPNVQCPYATTDVDCSGVTDIFDVTHLVNVAFRNGDPGAEFCDPCAPNL